MIDSTMRAPIPPGRPAPAPPSAPGAPTEKEWTVLIYAASDNNLMSNIEANLDDVERVGSNDQVNVVAQFDWGRKVGAKRLFLTKDDQPDQLTSPVVGTLGNTDMANPDTLADFIGWGMKNYPARHYFLVINDHGGGWQGACSDDGHGTWMTTPQLEEGLKKAREASGGRRIDVLGFDACLMSQAEVLHQLGGECDFMVASQETEGAAGWGYSRILSADLLQQMQETVRSRMKLDPRELAMDVVHAGQGNETLPTLSAFDMAKVPSLSEAVSKLGSAISASVGTPDQFAQIAVETQGFNDFRDLYDFADRVRRSDIQDDRLKEAATGVLQAVKDSVIAEQHAREYWDAHGVSIELNGPADAYRNLKFAAETQWTGAQEKISAGHGIPPPPPDEPTDPDD